VNLLIVILHQSCEAVLNCILQFQEPIATGKGPNTLLGDKSQPISIAPQENTERTDMMSDEHKPPVKPTHLPLNLNRDYQNNTVDGSLIFTNSNATIVGGGREMPPLHIKTKPIVDDYEITGVTLGLGINGKVVECTNKKTGAKYALKVLRDNVKARREVELHWRASGCKHIVCIRDVYQNNYKGQSSLLVIMEWLVLQRYSFYKLIPCYPEGIN